LQQVTEAGSYGSSVGSVTRNALAVNRSIAVEKPTAQGLFLDRRFVLAQMTDRKSQGMGSGRTYFYVNKADSPVLFHQTHSE
jgi:hypothetical protein